MPIDQKFTVLPEHLKLLSHIYFGYDGWTEFGAPEVDPKRPYGNSNVYEDIGEILGEEPELVDSWDEKEFSPEQRDRFLRLHKEMQTVLQILVCHAADGISEGTYSSSNYGSTWRRDGN